MVIDSEITGRSKMYLILLQNLGVEFVATHIRKI